MHPLPKTAYVQTIGELCRTCYTCVRECPGKAIRIVEGQAHVVPERCIACGNCVKVCTQKAKQPIVSLPEVEELLASGHKVAALIAPSWPADFVEVGPQQLASMLRALGFHKVMEVGFGADLVAACYKQVFDSHPTKRYIATSCPAVVGYVERYHPNLVGSLSPIVSPMVATARALRKLYGEEWKAVFVGPCIAKKVEAHSSFIDGEINSVITFAELRDFFIKRSISPNQAPLSEFDPPHPNLGALFAISRGMLQAARLEEDLVSGQVVATKGRNNFLESLKEFDEGNLDARLLEILACQGCIMGPGMHREAPLFPRRSLVSRYVRERMRNFDSQEWQGYMDRLKDLDLTRTFVSNDQRLSSPDSMELRKVLADMGKKNPVDELNCGACGYDTCREHATAIIKGLAESEMCLPFTIERLRLMVDELAVSHEKLASAQQAILQSGRMVSMGQLAAGIAHEVNNPLGVVLMYAHILLDQCAEDSANRKDLEIIVDQADRCKKIVSGLLNFARQTKVLRQKNDIKDLIERSLVSVPKPESISLQVNYKIEDPALEVDGDQVIQVITNLLSNAYAAMPDGGTLSIEVSGDTDNVHISIKDTGCGIPKENLKKIFEPFFTTKQIGKGTGLGLAVVYGIIKMHKGDINVHSNTDPQKGPTGSTFEIILSRTEGRLGEK